MSNSLQLLQQLLELETKKYLGTTEQLAYECGYLTGILTSIMDKDESVYHAVLDRIEKTKHE